MYFNEVNINVMENLLLCLVIEKDFILILLILIIIK